MKYTNIALALLILMAAAVARADIQCTSEICDALTSDQSEALENLVNDQIDMLEASDDSEGVIVVKPRELNLNLSTEQIRNIVNKNFLTVKKQDKIRFVTNDGEMDAFSAAEKATSEKPTVRVAKSGSYLGVNYTPVEDYDTFISASVNIEKSMVEKTTKIGMSTIGFGTHMRDGWEVAIGAVRPAEVKGSAKINFKPDGYLLVARRKW